MLLFVSWIESFIDYMKSNWSSLLFKPLLDWYVIVDSKFIKWLSNSSFDLWLYIILFNYDNFNIDFKVS